jgi:hypothetical protein
VEIEDMLIIGLEIPDRLAIEKVGAMDVVPYFRQIGRTLKKIPASQWCSFAMD